MSKNKSTSFYVIAGITISALFGMARGLPAYLYQQSSSLSPQEKVEELKRGYSAEPIDYHFGDNDYLYFYPRSLEAVGDGRFNFKAELIYRDRYGTLENATEGVLQVNCYALTQGTMLHEIVTTRDGKKVYEVNDYREQPYYYKVYPDSVTYGVHLDICNQVID